MSQTQQQKQQHQQQQKQQHQQQQQQQQQFCGNVCIKRFRDFDNTIIINSLFGQNREWRVLCRDMCVIN